VPGQDNAAAATPAGPAPAGADAVPAGGGAAREQEAAPGPGERQVRMVFDQRSWVEIRDGSGRLIFSQLNDAGTEQRVYGRPPLSVVVGNARGVRLTYGERAVDLMPHTKVDVARLTLE
jgi:cytoskeleton protein RodZ